MIRPSPQRGFTLVEMLVAVALFSVIMLVAVGSLLALVGVNKKVQSVQSVMDNLNITLDGMVRGIRMGSNFHCGGGNYQQTHDCATGDTTFAFEPYGNKPADPPTIYYYNAAEKRLYRTTDGVVSNAVPITAPEVAIESFTFYVAGTDRGCAVNPCNTMQPKVVIIAKGSAGADKSKTSFHVQVTAVQRLLDL